MKEKIQKVLSSIVARFESGDIPEAVAYSMFPVANVPSAKWSLLNRTLQFFSGTADGRGFQQWKAANRSVKKGAKAFYILVPYIKKVENKETGEEEPILKGFMASPVFRVEDTDGESLDYEMIELPEFPLLERAKEWGISVKAIPGDYRYYGYFALEKKEIALATPEEKTFFHELAHAGHEFGKRKTCARARPVSGDCGRVVGAGVMPTGWKNRRQVFRQFRPVYCELCGQGGNKRARGLSQSIGGDGKGVEPNTSDSRTCI